MIDFGMIKAVKLVHEYIRRDEEGNVDSIQTALDHIDLDIKAGEFIAILGHNGSGKSTLAKHINAILTPSEVLCGSMEKTRATMTASGMCARAPEWFSRIRTTRLLQAW